MWGWGGDIGDEGEFGVSAIEQEVAEEAEGTANEAKQFEPEGNPGALPDKSGQAETGSGERRARIRQSAVG